MIDADDRLAVTRPERFRRGRLKVGVVQKFTDDELKAAFGAGGEAPRRRIGLVLVPMLLLVIGAILLTRSRKKRQAAAS